MHRRLAPILTLLLAAASARAASFEDQRTTADKDAPAGVTLTISLAQKTFHQGELIPLQFSFIATEENRWQLTASTYDRSGRLGCDSYILSPADGAADPLAHYFEVPTFGGGLTSTPTLTLKPYLMKFDLNEWLRFDRPGKYKLFVLSNRLRDLAEKDPKKYKVESAVSNVIEFEILPADETWQKDQLADILKILDKEPANIPAIRRLRFLGTPETAPELARRLGQENNIDGQLAFGLFALRDRAAARAAMRNRLTAPDQTVSYTYLWMLSKIEELATRPPEDPATMTPAMWQKHDTDRLAALTAAADRLAASLPAKNPRARAESAFTLLLGQTEQIARYAPAIREILPSIFPDLTLERQSNVLQYYWDSIGSPAMAPLLGAILEKTFNPDAPDKSSVATLRTHALVRTYQLDPEKIRPAVLEILKHPGNSFDSYNINALMLLPDKTLPEAEAAWIDSLTKNPKGANVEFIYRFLTRYGTAASLPEMKERFEEHLGRYACSLQTDMLTYFLRIDPAYAKKQLPACLAARGKNFSRCWAGTLAEVATKIWTPELESVCLDSLSSDQSEITASAAAALAAHGSADARKNLLAALAENWTPAAPIDTQAPKDPLEHRQLALTQAAISAANWVLTEAEITQLESLVKTNQIKSDRARELIADYRKARSKAIPIYLAVYENKLSANVLDTPITTLDILHAKLLQYPKGTPFKITNPPFEFFNQPRLALLVWARHQNIPLED